MKLKRRDLVEFYHKMQELTMKGVNAKFQYALNKNLKKIFETQKEVDAQAIVAGYDTYINEFGAFESSIAEKDKEGKAIVTGRNPVSNLPFFKYPAFSKEEAEANEKSRKEIAERHEDVIKEHQEKLMKHKETLEEEIEFDFHCVSLDNIPDVTGDQIEALEVMIKD
jgi:hypothetical protein